MCQVLAFFLLSCLCSHKQISQAEPSPVKVGLFHLAAFSSAAAPPGGTTPGAQTKLKTRLHWLTAVQSVGLRRWLCLRWSTSPRTHSSTPASFICVNNLVCGSFCFAKLQLVELSGHCNLTPHACAWLRHTQNKQNTQVHRLTQAPLFS